MIRMLGLMVVASSLVGCQSYLSLIDGLNQREVQSCLEYQGMIRAGTGAGGHLRGITMTGGADIEVCRELLYGGRGNE